MTIRILNPVAPHKPDANRPERVSNGDWGRIVDDLEHSSCSGHPAEQPDEPTDPEAESVPGRTLSQIAGNTHYADGDPWGAALEFTEDRVAPAYSPQIIATDAAEVEPSGADPLGIPSEEMPQDRVPPFVRRTVDSDELEAGDAPEDYESPPGSLRRSSSVGREGTAGLSLRLPQPEALGKHAPDPVARALPEGLFSPEVDVSKPSVPRHAMQWAVGLAVVCIIALGTVYFRMPAPVTPGMVSVVSEPSGASIRINGQWTEHTTPSPLFEFAPTTVVTFSAEKKGYISEPESRTVTVAEANAETVFFSLTPVRTVRVITEPPGAEVRINGRGVASVSPVDVPKLPVGAAIRIQAELDGYLPVDSQIVVNDEDPQVIDPIVMVPAVQITVESSPNGASVYWGEKYLGQTPVYDAVLPKGDRGELRIDKPGYRTVRRRYRLTRGKSIQVSLQEKRLSQLKLSPAERIEARQLDRELLRSRRALGKAQSRLLSAERQLDAVLSDSTTQFAVRARAEAEVDDATHDLARAEQRLQDAQIQVDAFRDSLDGN